MVANWLAGRSAPDYLQAAAEHYQQAGDMAQAVRHYRLAAHRLRERGYAREARAASELADRCAAAASG